MLLVLDLRRWIALYWVIFTCYQVFLRVRSGFTLAVTAYTDKMVQIDTELMRLYWFSFKVHVF